LAKPIEEVAQATGFSVTTVRLVTSGQGDKYRISAATQQLIGEYVREHGYILNHAARSLKLKRSDAIGLVVPEISNLFFAGLMAELEALCDAHGLVLLTATTHGDPTAERRTVQNLLARGVDGIILAPCGPPEPGPGRKPRTPMVMIDRDYPGSPCPAVVSDNCQGATELTRAMFATAREAPLFLCAKPELPSIAARVRGFRAVCREQGRGEGEGLLFHAPADNQAAGRAMAEAALAKAALAGGDAPPAALMCSSLLVLQGAMQVVKARYGRIPPEIVIGSFDDHTMLDFLPNRVLAIAQDRPALARRAFDLLRRQMAGETVARETETVPVRLIRRG